MDEIVQRCRAVFENPVWILGAQFEIIGFSVAATPDGAVISGERGAEFSHRAECEAAAPAHTADVSLRVEKVDCRRDIIVTITDQGREKQAVADFHDFLLEYTRDLVKR